MRKILFRLTLSMIMAFGLSSAHAQNDAAALANADTSAFSVNKAAGWSLYNAFVTEPSSDSLQLELIVAHTGSLSWTQEQYIGKLKTAALIPSGPRIAPFNLVGTGYSLRIDDTGACYLQLISGAPAPEPIVIPVRVTYKK